MRNKQLNKKDLDKLLRYIRSYWGCTATDLEALHKARVATAEQLVGSGWLALLCLLDGIFGVKGFCKNASNKTVYIVLRLLGWEVVEAVEEDNAE